MAKLSANGTEMFRLKISLPHDSHFKEVSVRSTGAILVKHVYGPGDNSGWKKARNAVGVKDFEALKKRLIDGYTLRGYRAEAF